MPRKTTREPVVASEAASTKNTKINTRKTTPVTTPVKKTSSRKTTARRRSARGIRPAPAIRTEPSEEVPVSDAVPAPLPANGQWRRIDLHMHTPASRDYEQPEVQYLDILRQAERRGLDMIAFTDHNTANGYRNMQREIADLELLERLGRIRADELGRLNEYRRLLKKILVLPGFEVTATFGFHIIGIFPPDKSQRDIDFLLMQMRVPSKVIEQGLTEAGGTNDVLTAYRLIAEAGGIAIAPHANSSSGVFMRGMNVGGQTRIAYTQDQHLSAIELTDLAKGRRSMATWFNGHKPEYARRMHIIQGSDAHRLTGSPTASNRLGLGERATEVFLPELSFNALRDLFRSSDFDLVRRADAILDIPNDVLVEARQKGNNASLSFHAALPKRGDRFLPILSDLVAFANAGAGAVYIGCDSNPHKAAVGVEDVNTVVSELAEAIQNRIAPVLNVAIDTMRSDDVNVVRAAVSGADRSPYVIDGSQFFVRHDADTQLATRDEIVELARKQYEGQPSIPGEQKPAQHAHRQTQAQSQRHPQQGQRPTPQQQQTGHPPQRSAQPTQQQPQHDQGKRQTKEQQSQRYQQQKQTPQQPATTGKHAPTLAENGKLDIATEEPPKSAQGPAPVVEPLPEGTPKSGVEILSVEERDKTRYYTVRDLRNKSVVRNVTQKSARDLWLYAVIQHSNEVYDIEQVQWTGNRSVLSRSQRAGKVRYDLALRDIAGKSHIFYGVADDAIDGRWKELIQATMPEPIIAATDNVPTPVMEAPALPVDAAAVTDDTQTGNVEAAGQVDASVTENQPIAGNIPAPENQS